MVRQGGGATATRNGSGGDVGCWLRCHPLRGTAWYVSERECLANSDGSWGPPRGSVPCRPLIVGEGEQRFWAYDFKGIKPGSLGATRREACEYQRQHTTARTSPCVPIAVRFIE